MRWFIFTIAGATIGYCMHGLWVDAVMCGGLLGTLECWIPDGR